jgi:hypothetical protein
MSRGAKKLKSVVADKGDSLAKNPAVLFRCQCYKISFYIICSFLK